MAHELGSQVLALMMTGGVTGRLIEELLDEAGLPWKSLPIGGRTRISLNVRDRQSGLAYRFVPDGPRVAEAEWRGALETLRISKSARLTRSMARSWSTRQATHWLINYTRRCSDAI